MTYELEVAFASGGDGEQSKSAKRVLEACEIYVAELKEEIALLREVAQAAGGPPLSDPDRLRDALARYDKFRNPD